MKMRGPVIFEKPWTKFALRTAVTCLYLLYSVKCVPVMKTSPENVTAVVGGTVILRCQVQDLQDFKINWLLVEHNTQISKGNTILVSSLNKYSFVTHVDSSVTQMNLQIQNVQISDTGHYRCYVTGTAASVSHSLRVTGIQDLRISQIPDGILDLGSSVNLLCNAVANPPVTFVWMKDGKTIGRGQELTFGSVNESDSGLYICTASNNDGDKSVSAFLPVKYKPSVVSHKDDTVEPDKGLDAVLTCWFDGFPDVTTVKWQNADTVIRTTNTKVQEERNVQVNLGLTECVLKIFDLVGGDYDLYVCSASNSYGSATGAVRLNDPTANLQFRNRTIIPRVTNITECCIEKKIESDCMNACTYNVSRKDFFRCSDHIATITECGADGSDHSKCCKKKDVADFCLPFCSGNVPGGSEENIMTNPLMGQCVDHIYSIRDCMEENREKVPNAPEFVARLRNGNIIVKWNVPTKNGDKVQKYLIYYEADDIPREHISLSSSVRIYLITNVNTDEIYRVWIVAANDYGQSLPSTKFKLRVTAPLPGILPQSPTNVVSEIVSSTKFRIRWSAPTDDPTINGYIFVYKKSSDNNYKQIQTSSLSLQLEQLEAESDYEAYVVSQNSEGNSYPSQKVYFTTGEAVMALQSGQTVPLTAQIGLGVGLTLGVIAIIVLLIVVFRFRRGKTGGPAERISFDNPLYGRKNVQITGLSADDLQPSNQFSYGHLDKDHTMGKGEQKNGVKSTFNRYDGDVNNPDTLPVITD